jgi:hypothetical protein
MLTTGGQWISNTQFELAGLLPGEVVESAYLHDGPILSTPLPFAGNVIEITRNTVKVRGFEVKTNQFSRTGALW